MKCKLTLMVALTAASFSYNAKALGFYTETELAPAASFLSLTGNPVSGALTTAGSDAVSFRDEISFLGGTTRQSFGYSKWFTLDTALSFGLSLGGMGTTTLNSVPAGGTFFEATGESYISLPLAKDESLLLEPMLGFGYLWLDIQDMMDGGRYGRENDAAKVNVYGPMGGLFTRMYIADNFSMRVGLAYQITQMQTDAFNSYGMLQGKPALRARRHGTLGRLRFDYKASDFVAFMLGLDVQSWSAGGSTAYIDSPYPSLPVTLLINRSRISWGVNFKY